ncbi:MAG: EAL domain-containing protein [Nitrospirae bacterium]|nr:EAL domain-containing protein [Nitrospirota bacterium]
MARTSILIVEDEAIIALDLRATLSEMGYLVTAVAASGEEAIAQAARTRPDLVLMDVKIEGEMDGVETAGQIWSQLGIPIVYLTAHADDHTLLRIKGTQPFGYVLKPVNERDLHAVIEIALTRHALEGEIRAHERRLAAILTGIGEAVLAVDRRGVVTLLNPGAEALTGWTREEAVGRAATEVFRPLHEQTRRPVANPLLTVLHAGERAELAGPMLLVAKDGRETPIDGNISPVRTDDGRLTGAVLIFRDVTERRRTETLLTELAHYDSLTGLPNRRLFLTLLDRALARAGRTGKLVALLFLDLDNFKRVNDTLGHAVGDRLLTAVADRLRACARKNDTVARLGGDEFTILIEDLSSTEDVARVAQKNLDALGQPITLAGHELVPAHSIGIALFPTDNQDRDGLLMSADTAMYAAKGEGGGAYRFYSAKMNARSMERLVSETDLRRALKQAEFLLHYQPVVDSATATVVGVEALVRWRHPTRGLLMPDTFLPLAEDTGLIIPLGAWVLRAACAQMKAWNAQGATLQRIAVNLSARQIQQPTFPETVLQILRETGLPPSRLELELPKSLLSASSDERIPANIRALHESGVRLAVTWFGAEYSALGPLRRLPLATVKIDQACVRELATHPEEIALLKAIIHLGRSLNLDVIAEGVETEQEAALLRAQACPLQQGYHFTRPGPVESLSFDKK